MKVKCPECGHVIDLSESDSAAIISQVRTEEFDKELASYKERLEKEKEAELKMAELESSGKMKEELSKQEAIIAELKAKIAAGDNEKQLAVTKALSEKQDEINTLKTRITNLSSEKEIAVTQAVAAQQTEIVELKARLASAETAEKLAVTEALAEEAKKHAEILKTKEEELEEAQREVDYYKNKKLTMSTKAIGESLELHCQDEYDMRLRPLIPHAYFEKDNEISESGSKGDYIFREEKDGIPLLSIMFEMKNDSETTENRHKNSDFFKELDKDRREKGCEYAVLVSLLENESELYNQGIVDVSHRYPKMFVIRPQFLVPLITLLRNAALSAHESKLELATVREQNIDVTNFESDLEAFKAGFSRSCELTGKKFEEAINQIDKAIKDLERVKEALTSSGKHLIAADNKLEDLTIKKLTRKNPTMKAKFDEARDLRTSMNVVDANTSDTDSE